MRALLFTIFGIIVVVGCGNASADSPVLDETRGQSIDARDANYLKTFVGPARTPSTTAMREIADGSFKVKVLVIGPLTDNQVVALLRSIVIKLDMPVTQIARLNYTVVGDTHRASVKIDFDCGRLCGDSEAQMRTFDGRSWKFLYTYGAVLY